MDFFRGSSRPNFIFFCLDNQNSNETQTPYNQVLEIPAESPHLQVPTSGAQPDTPTGQDSGQLNFVTLVASPGRIDSQTDVIVYAAAMVRQLESSQTSEPNITPAQISVGLDGSQEPREQRESYSPFIPKLDQYPFPT